MSKTTLRNYVDIKYESFLSFPDTPPFGITGKWGKDLVVQNLNLVTSGKLLENSLFIEQTLVGTAVSESTTLRGLEGSLGIAYEIQREDRTDVRMSQIKAAESIYNQHQTIVTKIQKLYMQGKKLPQRIGSLKRI